VTRVVILWEPDDSCVDPLDSDANPRRHYDDAGLDFFLVWRQQVDADEPDGHDDIHVAAGGIFEHISLKQAQRIVRKMGLL
jgi:hypothetical protein